MAKGDDPAAATGRPASPDPAAADALAKAERKAAKVAKKAAKRERELAEAAAALASQKAAKAAKKAAKAVERERLDAEAAADRARKKAAKAARKAARTDRATGDSAPLVQAKPAKAGKTAARDKTAAREEKSRARQAKAEAKAHADAKAMAKADAKVRAKAEATPAVEARPIAEAPPKAKKAATPPKPSTKDRPKPPDRGLAERAGGAAATAGSILQEVAGLVRQAAEPAAARIVERIRDVAPPPAPEAPVEVEPPVVEAPPVEAPPVEEAAPTEEAAPAEGAPEPATEAPIEAAAVAETIAEPEPVALGEAEPDAVETADDWQSPWQWETVAVPTGVAAAELIDALAPAEPVGDTELEAAAAERLEAERAEVERLEAERLDAQRLEAERIEAERIEAERLEAERLEAERLEAERLEAERLEAERIEAERLEAERLEAERLEAERQEAERQEAERIAAAAAVAAVAEPEASIFVEEPEAEPELAAQAEPVIEAAPEAAEPAADFDDMPLTLEQPAAEETVEAAAAQEPPEDEESVAARLAALGLVAGGAAVAAGAAGVAGIADAAERALEHDEAQDTAERTDEAAEAEEAPARIIDFRPSPAPVSTQLEAEPSAPWPEADLGAPTDASVEAAPDVEVEAPVSADAEPLEDAAAATLVVETVEVVRDDEIGALLVEAEAEAIVEAIPEAEAELEPRPIPAPEIIPLPTTVVAATVDVGANSAHLLVAAVTGHLVEPLLDESAFLGLGDRVATHGFLGADARDELVATLAGYADAARSLGASSVTFVGTEPVRRAADAAPLIHAVEGRANAPLHVLDHDEEAKLTLLGVTGGKRVDSELLVIDIGGGSSEFVIVGPDRPVAAIGIRLGSATLTKEHSKADPPSLKEIEAMRKAAKAAIASAPDANPAEIIAVGGTASNLLKLLPATAIDRMLTRRRITVALAMLTVQRSAEAAERHMLRPQRARVLPAGALIVDAILERYAAERLRVCDEGIREGMVLAAATAGLEWRDRLSTLVVGWEDGAGRA